LTSFHYALEYEDLKIIKLLLPQQNNDSLFTISSGKFTTPTHFAVERGHLELFEILLEHFSNNGQSIINDGWTLIHTAARSGRLEIINILEKKYKTPLNITTETGMTPLHLAVIGGRQQTVEYLVSQMESVDIEDNKGKTPMDYASGRGNAKIIQILNSKANKRIRDEYSVRGW